MRRRSVLGQLAGAAAGTCAALGSRPASPASPARKPVAPDAVPALRRSDVVFMYEAKAETYREYGATVLAWGGRPTPEKLQAAAGVTWHGSVGMVTEFGEYYERFPQSWEAGLCRDVHGQPIKVPWLTDHQHKGVPFWWCCTRQPQFRQYLEERVAGTLKSGAAGLHVDDHLGSSGALFLGACFCGRCVEGFRSYLGSSAPARRSELGVSEEPAFDYGATVRKWLADGPAGETRRVQDHPLWREWSIYQLRSAAACMRELRAVAERAAGRRVPVSVNAGLLWPNHLADYAEVDYLSAETDHQASSRRLGDRPLFAYRMADAVRRPYAATATGQDWAFVKEQGCSGLVTGWIALSYAAGQRLMAPHHQWCYTEEKGTHWYEGPAAVYAPLYRFVREQALLLDGCEGLDEVAVVMPHRSWVEQPDRWLGIGDALAAAGVGYRLVIGSDEVVESPITAAHFDGVRAVVNPAPEALFEADRLAVEQACRSRIALRSVEAGISAVRPAVRVEGEAPVRVLPRGSRGSLVLHVLNRAYEPQRDDFRTQAGVALSLDRQALGVRAGARAARILAPAAPPAEAALGEDGRLAFDLVGPWAVVVIDRQG